ncbi:MAG: Ig-like domain-containing protein [Agathobacter sp.]|nr:Ig-like domain-containing protein [Agathobacter sp.]
MGAEIEDTEFEINDTEIEIEDTEIEIEDTTIAVTDIEISDHEDVVNVGETLSLSATVLPVDATNSTVTYKSSDEAIAMVNSSGEVKGISKGSVIIYVSADNVTKEVPLTVKVATAGIKVNNDYLVLKQGSTFQLSTTVTPVEANQSVTYRSIDESIATVTDKGFVSAKKVGNTTILVSNGESSVAVSVIVNQSSVFVNDEVSEDQSADEVKEYADSISASAVEKIDADTLYHIYSTGKILEIVGDGYTIEIDGKDIVNYKNEFYTDIQLVQKEEGTSFTLNKSEFLCGEVTLHLSEPNGKYLYLYNTSKEKYELIQTDSLRDLKLTTPGEYLISSEMLSYSTVNIIYFIVFGVVAILIGVGVYIGVKKRYWFW